MYCAECGNKINGIKCCNGLGYWDKVSPLPQDYIKLATYKGWYLYLSGYWPEHKKATKPKLEKI